ncbi:hypothetical protein A0H81_06886 [Grifola frondosa]|uniref:Uncharacterized protein n=1 Tax=Grifola frondosa TaxID=5627 RepID=A0A1C7M7L0_GRIFR|nr:hypothetical protein A0H81_06886 [Grifola frondosa]
MSGTRNLHTYDIVGPNPYESQEARAMPHTTVPLAAEYAERPAEVAQVASVSRSEMAAQPTEDELAISPLPSKQRKITIVGPKKGKNEGIRKPAPKKQHRSAKGKKNRPRPECLYRGCTDSCSRPRDRDRHMLIHFPPQYPCEACIRPLSIHRHDVFQRHMRDFHPELEDVSVELPYPWELNTKLIRKFKMPPSRDVDRVSCFIRQEKQKAAFDI